MDIKAIYNSVLEYEDKLIEMRRDLHRIPEPGFEEVKTRKYICDRLDEMGIAYRAEQTWIVADIKGSEAGPTVALRADIDALPVTEPLKYDYRSEHEGMMHACGHDMHTTILLGAGKWLNAHRDLMKGNVRLLFQPAEETDGGAKPMVEAGVMEGVDRVFGQHVQPYMNVGVIDGMRGTLNASTDEVRITVHGVSCHAARPEGGVDAIVCAGAMISSLQTVVSRSVTPLKPSVLTFGTINGGRARNIVCDCVELGGTLRTADPVLRETMKRRIREVAEGVAAAYGAKVDVEIISGFDALINDDHEIDRLMRLGRELLGDANVLTREAPSMGGEDFSYFCEAVPGAFYHLGCGKQQPAPTLHSCDFDPDEKCMAIGVAMQCAAALDVMNEMH